MTILFQFRKHRHFAGIFLRIDRIFVDVSMDSIRSICVGGIGAIAIQRNGSGR